MMRSSFACAREVPHIAASGQRGPVRWHCIPPGCQLVCQIPPPWPQEPPLLDRVREEICKRHYGRRTGQFSVGWVHRFVLVHGKRQPAGVSEAEDSRYLSDLRHGNESKDRITPLPAKVVEPLKATTEMVRRRQVVLCAPGNLPRGLLSLMNASRRVQVQDTPLFAWLVTSLALYTLRRLRDREGRD